MLSHVILHYYVTVVARVASRVEKKKNGRIWGSLAFFQNEKLLLYKDRLACSRSMIDVICLAVSPRYLFELSPYGYLFKLSPHVYFLKLFPHGYLFIKLSPYSYLFKLPTRMFFEALPSWISFY